MLSLHYFYLSIFVFQMKLVVLMAVAVAGWLTKKTVVGQVVPCGPACKHTDALGVSNGRNGHYRQESIKRETREYQKTNVPLIITKITKTHIHVFCYQSGSLLYLVIFSNIWYGLPSIAKNITSNLYMYFKVFKICFLFQ